MRRRLGPGRHRGSWGSGIRGLGHEGWRVFLLPGLVVRKPHAAGFIGSRWRGEASAAVVYWRDVLAVGSIINLFTGFAALMLAAQGVNLLIAAVVHFAMLPYNVFLVVALWRTPSRTQIMAWTSLIWLGAVTVL